MNCAMMRSSSLTRGNHRHSVDLGDIRLVMAGRELENEGERHGRPADYFKVDVLTCWYRFAT